MAAPQSPAAGLALLATAFAVAALIGASTQAATLYTAPAPAATVAGISATAPAAAPRTIRQASEANLEAHVMAAAAPEREAEATVSGWPLAAAAFVAVGAFFAALHQRLSGAPRRALVPLSLQEVPSSQWAMASLFAAKPLEGKVALVTGATRGIGAAIAKALGEAGATVIGTATSDSGAQTISAALQASGIKGEGMLLNVTSDDQIKEAVKVIGDKYGPPTIIVNNAGITKDKLLMQMKDDDWDAVIDTNLTSIFRITKAFQRGLSKAKWGRIINISSVVGSIGNMGQANYASAKAGIEGFTKAVAREMSTRNVTVNSVAPGFIETDMTKDLPEEWADKLKSSIPLGRMGTAEEVAAAVLFLALPSSGYITGQTLHVNGGMYMN